MQMPSGKRKVRVMKRKSEAMNIETLVQKQVEENTEVQLVLEIAMRARDAAAKEPPINIGMARDIIAIPTNSQYPV